jgi:uncharacterized protein with beta-barrel porin domain
MGFAAGGRVRFAKVGRASGQRRVAIAAAALLAVLMGSEGAQALCTPPSPVNNAAVTCTGTTTDQNGNVGYGTGADHGNTITVTPGASVTGSNTGIFFNTGTILNSGAITGTTNNGVFANSALTLTNSGTVSAAAAAVVSLGTATVTNSGTITGSSGVNGQTALTLTNTGTISATASAVITNLTATVTNSGTISAGTNGISAFTATVTNSGTISTGQFGVLATTATVTNTGIISGAQAGIRGNTLNVTNSGTITGATGILNLLSPADSVTNSGTIVGTGGTAIQLSTSADTLTVLPGSWIVGAIKLRGGGDTVTVLAPNQNLTFDTLAGAHVSSIQPSVVSGNQIVTIDTTPFGFADRTLMDFTRSISSILGSLGGAGASQNGPLSSAFAPSDGIAARVDDAFAAFQGSIPALAYAGDQAMVFKNPTYVAADGRAVWARGFGGARTQDPDGLLFGARTTWLGGAVGFDMVARPDLRLGLFAGGGQSRLSLDQNAAATNTDTTFGGVYGRWGFTTFGAPSVLDVALHGGHSTNATSRTINNNLAPGGIETATASYTNSYVSPEARYAVHLPLWSQYTLTPSIGVRYVAGFFGGYTEVGTTAPLTVASRTIGDFEERGELELTRTTPVGPDLLVASLHVGVLGIERMGDTTVNTVLLGASLPFVTPGRHNVTGVVGGGGLEWRTREGISFFGAAEAIGMSDQSTVIDGRGGIRVAF